LAGKLHSFPNQLSGGERARVALIRGIINKPRILFADEPTGNLDEENASNLIKLLMKINKKYNQAIVITTHNPNVANIGNKKFKLEKGNLK
jgi:ABC-type lipoprotein export system ATPase subunit